MTKISRSFLTVSLLLSFSSAFSSPLTGWVRKFDSNQSDNLRWSPEKFQNITLADFDFLQDYNYRQSTFFRSLNNQLRTLDLNGVVDPSLSPVLMDGLSLDVKKVFSDKKRRCIAAGTPVASTLMENLCCTGNAEKTPDGVVRCALPDYANISIYLNPDVSSEGEHIHPEVKMRNDFLASYACTKNLCASGYISTGALWGLFMREDWGIDDYRTLNSSDYDSENRDLAIFFDKGARWAEDLYCIPAEAVSAFERLGLLYNRTVVDCSSVIFNWDEI